MKLIALEQSSTSIDYRTLDITWKEHCCLVVGNETEGVNGEILSKMDAHIEIPMRGIKQSLNV